MSKATGRKGVQSRSSRPAGHGAAANTSTRRGPRTDIDSRTLIIDTAERMFGDETIDAVSMRAVAREAGLGTRAVTYHFPSRSDLVAAVLKRRLPVVAQATTEGLAALRERRAAPSVREVVETILTPYVNMLREEPRPALRWIKVFNQLALTEDQVWTDEFGAAPTFPELFLAAAARALPEITDEKVQRQTALAMYSMVSMLAGADLAAYGHPLGPHGLDPEWVEQLVIFTSAGLQGASIDAVPQPGDHSASNRAPR
jgi:AcrR family transcriptional regulator